MKDLSGLEAAKLPDSWVNQTRYIDFETETVKAFVAKSLEGVEERNDTEKAIALFNAVRDDIRYDPYQMEFVEDHYKASHVAALPEAYCVPKAILLTACLRSIGIPAGVGFADVQNHLNSPKLAAIMETDLFSYHGYVGLKLEGKVYKVTPTFNKELCERFGVQAIEFDGTADALFHEYDAEKRQHMEYVKDRGLFEDPPMEDVLHDMAELYPKIKALNAGHADVAEDPDFAA